LQLLQLFEPPIVHGVAFIAFDEDNRFSADVGARGKRVLIDARQSSRRTYQTGRWPNFIRPSLANHISTSVPFCNRLT
jgi:hypothetical protein